MKKIALALLLLLACVGAASAYVLEISAPTQVQVGAPLIVSGTTTFPTGTSFQVTLTPIEFAVSTPVATNPVVVGSDGQFSTTFDTRGLMAGQYKVEAILPGELAGQLSSGSVTLKLVTVIDRSKEIAITSPATQTIPDALQIDGSIANEGNAGVQLTVTGPSGPVFGPQYIGTTIRQGNPDGFFSQRISVIEPGNYFVTFSDAKGFIGTVKFVVNAGQTSVATPATTVPPSTTPPLSVVPTTTSSPVSAFAVPGALCGAGALAAWQMRRRNR